MLHEAALTLQNLCEPLLSFLFSERAASALGCVSDVICTAGLVSESKVSTYVPTIF